MSAANSATYRLSLPSMAMPVSDFRPVTTVPANWGMVTVASLMALGVATLAVACGLTSGNVGVAVIAVGDELEASQAASKQKAATASRHVNIRTYVVTI